MTFLFLILRLLFFLSFLTVLARMFSIKMNRSINTEHSSYFKGHVSKVSTNNNDAVCR